MALIKCRECEKQISDKAKTCPSCGAEQKKKFSILKGLLYLFAAFIVIAWIGSSGEKSVGAGNVKNPKDEVRQNLAFDFVWNKSGFGSIMIISPTIQNGSTHAIKDIEIKCVSKAASGTEIDTNRKTIYELFPAQQTKTVEKFNMGFLHSQATSTACEIMDFKIAN